MNLNYIDLQQRLKPYQVAGLTKINSNCSQSDLEAEYQRCLNLGLSQTELSYLADINRDLRLISAFEIYTCPEKYSLKTIKAKAYNLGDVNNLRNLKQAFPIFKDSQYDFRTKTAWCKCVYLIDRLTKNSQEFAKFKQDITAFMVAIQEQKYYQLTGETAVESAYEDLASYISCWKGAQWEYTLKQASTIDLLKRAWLEQYLAQHNLNKLLEYSPID